MTEIITDANGTIIAISAADDKRFAKRRRALPLAQPGPGVARAQVVMRALPGQFLHAVTLSDSVAGMSLKEIHMTHRVVVRDGTSHLERIR
jgi:hypothetical protein